MAMYVSEKSYEKKRLVEMFEEQKRRLDEGEAPQEIPRPLAEKSDGGTALAPAPAGTR
jgi:hypothetical protein